MNIFTFSTWAIGVLNGYKKSEGELPKSIPYTTMSIATTVTSFKMIKTMSEVNIIGSMLKSIVGSVFLSAIGIGSIYCIGNQVGKALAK